MVSLVVHPRESNKSKPGDGAITNYSILAKPATENTRSKPDERISGKKNPENPDYAAFGCQALFWSPDGRISSGLVLSATPVCTVAVEGAKSKAFICFNLSFQAEAVSFSYLQVMYPLHLFVFSVCSSRSRSE